ncbi:hypothetical protein KSP40_PGU013434 [Platanthera guangdongensis]|uniref:Uncharacterized protein n=1 Tax=Platanthera guangdongensis TaxID=2320717 RepID=A0ABR2LBY1_9ASPA
MGQALCFMPSDPPSRRWGFLLFFVPSEYLWSRHKHHCHFTRLESQVIQKISKC